MPGAALFLRILWLLGLLLWLAGLLLAEQLPASIPIIGSMAIGGHTEASIWLRLFSIPLRAAIAWQLGLALWQGVKSKINIQPNTIEVRYLQAAWQTVSLFYISDLYLFDLHHPQWTVAVTLTLLSAAWAAALLTGRGRTVMMFVLFCALTWGIWQAQASGTENNAFTTFGLQGLALMLGARRGQPSPGTLQACYLIPALGYIFPFFEKVLLNPLGWLSGQTMAAYAEIYTGQVHGTATGIALSLVLLGFQGSFLGILFKPALLPWLYAAAIVFHVVAGVILGFPGILNPWITALGIGWVAFLLNKPSAAGAQTTSVGPQM